MKKWNEYHIMHCNRKVATIFSNGSCKVYYKSFMPYNLYLENVDNNDIDERLNNLENFYHWCASRILTLDRKYAKEILNSIGKSQAITDRERAEIAISYHCLSLTDVFWVKSFDEEISFDEINLYNHSLSNAFVDVSLRGKQLTVQNAKLIDDKDVAGDIGTTGVAPKAWIRKNDKFYLMKDGDKREVDAELLASKIINCFDVDSVSYKPDVYDNEKVSVSEIITSLDVSIVSIEYIEIYAMNNNENKYDIIKQKDAYSYYMMNIVDYLVGNTDRHWGNWGFFVDNKSNKLLKLHSLMDFNKSFNSYNDTDGAKCLTTPNLMSQKDAAIEAVREIGLNQIKDVKKDWFDDEKVYNMFVKRLNILKNEI